MKNEVLKKPARAGFFYIATSILAKGIAFLATPVFTRVLSPEAYGVYQLYTSWLGILSVPLTLGISGGAIYRALGKFEGREGELISGTFGILILSHAAALAVGIALFPRLEGLIGLPPYICILLIGELFLNAAELVILARARYRYLYMRVCLINLLYASFSPLLALLLIYLTPLRGEARIISSFSVTAALILPVVLRTAKPSRLFSRKVWRYLGRLSLPMLPHLLFMALIAQSDKLMIEKISGTAELAKYSVAYSVGFMLTAVTSAVYSALQPWLMRKLNSHKTESARLFIKRVLSLTALGLSVFLFFTPELFRLVAGNSYLEAELAVYPLAIAGVLQFIANILASSIIHTEKTAALSIFSLLSFVLNLVLNLIFLRRFSYYAAAITTALSYGTLVVLEYLFLSRHRNDELVTRESFIPLLAALLPVTLRAFGTPLSSRILFAAALALAAVPTALKTAKMVRES